MRVAGVGQHMERKAAARRQSEEQRQREAKVFNEKPGTRTRPFTTPEPFKLATAKMEPRTQSRLEALAKDELDEARAKTIEMLAPLAPQLAYIDAIRNALPEDGVFIDELTQVSYINRLAMPV